jgi:twinkle protein
MREQFTDYGIYIGNKTTGQTKVKCPKCSHTRRKKNEPCLSVNIDEGVWTCHNCEWTGVLKSGDMIVRQHKKVYKRPKVKEHKDLTTKAIGWFKNRGIGLQTLVDNNITCGTEYMPQTQKKQNVIEFNYFRSGELVNVKYRDGNKNFKMYKDAEKIFYGIDHITSDDEKDVLDCVIVEGEMDKLSFWEAGVTNCVSVPNGASDKNMEYLESAMGVISNMSSVYIATDMDEKGQELLRELARRIGKHKCYKVSFQDCKDANEFLIKHGKEKLVDQLRNSDTFPVEGLVTVDDLSKRIDKIYEEGLKRGALSGDVNFDKLFSWGKSQLTMVTGESTHGKSNWVEDQMVKLSVNCNWKWAVFSPEHYPLELHFSVLAEKLIGKSFGGSRGEKMKKSELDRSKSFINDHFKWIRPEKDLYTLEDILSVAKELVYKYGVNGLLIDPYNKMSHDIGSKSETNYVNDLMIRLNNFKQLYDCHIILIAHPRKMQKDPNTGLSYIPTLSDISGSTNFKNQADNGITVYRNFQDNKTEVYVQKVKFRHMGMLGSADYLFNMVNGRYEPLVGAKELHVHNYKPYNFND